MFRTSQRYLNPLLWAVIGWSVAVIGNAFAKELSEHYWRMLIHADEVITGLFCGLLRYSVGEWKFEQVYADRFTEMDVMDAIQVLRDSPDESKKARAQTVIVRALQSNRPLRPGQD